MGDREKYINEKARHLLNNNLALFIGAGFSRIFGYPNGKWEQERPSQVATFSGWESHRARFRQPPVASLGA